MAGDQDFIGSLGGGGSAGAQATADQLRNQVLSQLVTVLQTLFPQASSSVTATATAGAGTLPAAPDKFLTITISGTAYKVALYKV